MSSHNLKTKTVQPWYGSNRNQAEDVGRVLAGCKWVGIIFFGGGSEAVYIDARTVVANDKHEGMMNLCAVIADRVLGPQFYRRIKRLPIAQTVLKAAQERCIQDQIADAGSTGLFASAAPAPKRPAVDRAVDYFVCGWMGRSGTAGTDGEFNGSVCVRWDAGGGDPAVRWKSAVKGIRSWQMIFRKYTFLNLDCFEFIANMLQAEAEMMKKPRAEWELRALYGDPPFPDAGDSYLHHFDEKMQRMLAAYMVKFKYYRVVLRFYDHPLVREIYPEDKWHYQHRVGRDAHNNKKPELLLILKNESSGLN